MIKLSLPQKPEALTDEVEKELVEEFKNNGSTVWKKSFIKEAVFNITNGKCAYSEVKLEEEGKFMQVDHFYPKSIYPDLVVRWGNLLPVLNHCNQKKGDMDPKRVDIVNPLVDNPKDSLYFIGSMLYGKNEKGCNTVSHLDSNNQSRLNEPRFRLLQSIRKQLKDIGYAKEEDIGYFVGRLKEIMKRGCKESVYSAAVSTFLFTEGRYQEYRSFLIGEELWDEEFDRLEKEMIFCSLPCDREVDD